MAGGRRGPAPQPAAVAKAKGNPGKRKLVTEEIEEEANEAAKLEDPVLEGPQPPEWLSDDGRKIWDDIAPRLANMKILQIIDATTFGRYCQDFGTWVQLQHILREEGTTYESESPHGTYRRSHPAFMQADRLNRTLISMESGFGLNPADRQRLFAARAAAANQGNLFGGGGEKSVSAGSAKPSGRKSAIGMLN